MFNGILLAIFNFAVKYYNLPFNPVARVGSIGKNKGTSMDFWTLEEYKQFIACVDEPIYKMIFELLFFTGLRCGELLALTYNDIDIKKGILTVNKNLAKVKGETIIQTPKTANGRRKITLPRFVVEHLQEYVKLLYGYKPSDRLFLVDKYALARMMNKYSELSGVEKIRIHNLRHSHASLLIHLGFTPTLIADRLGHENVTTTLNTYGHLYPTKQNEVAETLEKII